MSKEVYDYFVVGLGLAGTCFAEVLMQNNKKFLVFDNPFEEPSSKVAAGIFNAIILKRFTMVNNAQSQLVLLKRFYPQIEERLKVSFFYELPTYRKLSSIEEQNNFITASDRPLFQDFLSSEIVFIDYKSINATFGYGQMKQTGYVNTRVLIDAYKNFLNTNNFLCEQQFNYDEVIVTKDFVEYQGKRAKHIIFADGFNMRFNPFFKDLPLDGAKGELLIIKAKDLNLDVILKAGKFILPMGNDYYKVGATYDWEDKTNIPTSQAREELLSELKQIITCDFEVVNHLAGVRPTVKDRKPLVGRHYAYFNVYSLNGLGTRGVMLAPYLSEHLFNYIEFGQPLDEDIDINRVYKKRIS